MIIAIAITPPTAPPTIAPMGNGEGVAVSDDEEVVVVGLEGATPRLR